MDRTAADSCYGGFYLEGKRDIEKALANSLKELVVKMPFEKITIRQIADGAGVIRVTFYNHFQDKYDLLAWIVRSEILDPVRILVSNQMYRETLILIFSNLLRDKAPSAWSWICSKRGAHPQSTKNTNG